MGKVAKPLGALAVGKLTGAGYHAVGTVPGLYLQISEANQGAPAARSWILRTMVAAKRREIGLGSYPAVTLQMAHEAARAKLALIRGGHDPIAAAKAARAAIVASHAREVTFKACAAAYIAAHESGWKSAKHGQQWTNTLTKYAYPVLGSMFVGDVETAHVLQVVEPIWATKTETATRVRERIERVLDWATTRKYRDGPNPARWKGHMSNLLPPPRKVAKVKHHPALPAAEAPAFMARLRAAEGQGARALEFAILTAARSGEARGATWSEVDLDQAQWTIPGARMKVDADHRVPLSPRAVALLKKLAQEKTGYLVFPSPDGRPLSDMSLAAVIKRLNAADGDRWVDPKLNRAVVPHGFRTTFTDWATEVAAYSDHMTEMALAHAIKGKAKAAYMRGDLFEKRRQMMVDWAAYLAKLAGPARRARGEGKVSRPPV